MISVRDVRPISDDKRKTCWQCACIHAFVLVFEYIRLRKGNNFLITKSEIWILALMCISLLWRKIVKVFECIFSAVLSWKLSIMPFFSSSFKVYFQRVLSSKTAKGAETISYIAAVGCIIMAVPPILIGAIAKSTSMFIWFLLFFQMLLCTWFLRS